MRADRPALLFDLDDTLYPVSQFVRSGLTAVALHVEARWGIEARAVFRVLARARRTDRGRELQALAVRFGLPGDVVPALVQVVRDHRPRLRLPRATARTLASLAPAWRLAIVTNGTPAVQARKVEALGLERLVEVVVYAHAAGAGLGKPDAAPFREALARLGVGTKHAVFVGNDPAADVAGAAAVGIRTIQIRRRDAAWQEPATEADAVIESIGEVPSVAGRLLEGAWRSYVA